MILTAKPVIRDKFWIIESGGEKVATLQQGPNGLVLSNKDIQEQFTSIKNLTEKYQIVFTGDAVYEKANLEHAVKEKISEQQVHGFPTCSKPHNVVYDVKRQLPLFTKNEKSKSFFCAGYYIIRFPTGWVRSFCPKSITLARYEFKGPFATKIEMMEQLRRANGS